MRCRLLCLPALSEFTDELGPSLCSRCLPSTNRFKPKFCEPIQLSQSEERRELQKEHLVLHNARRRFQPFACSHPFQQSLSSPLLSSPLLSSLLHPTLVLQLLATHAYIKAKTRAPPRLQKKAPRAPARHQKKAQSSSHTIRRCPPFTRSAQNALSHDELGLLFANWINITPGKSSSNRTRFAIGTGISSGMCFSMMF